MRITGVEAADEYLRRYGCTDSIDEILTTHLRDGLLEFDLNTEKFFITKLGELSLWQGTCH